ncbi:MAG: formimidoylglutamase [Bacteroidota bacterium]|nr:formimidoylglutamase [Bacteroidota bacterium]
MEQLIDILKYYLDYQDSILEKPEFDSLHKDTIGKKISILSADFDYTELRSFHFALLGVKENRNTENKGSSLAPGKIREAFYHLFPSTSKLKLLDLGDLKEANTVNDTYFALRDLIEALIDNNIIPIIMGGGQDLTYAQYKAYHNQKQQISLTSIDSLIDLGEMGLPFTAHTFLGKILTEGGQQLFNYTNIACQQYLVSPADFEMMDNLFFDVYPLGDIQTDIHNAEPAIRDSQIISFDMSAIRVSEAPGTRFSTPNGLYGNEACQLAWYAGMSEKVSSFGIYEVNPTIDERERTSFLAAQIIWHFIDGFYNRINDYPNFDQNKHEISYHDVEVLEHKLSFVHSKSSGRWWIKIPESKKYVNNSIIISCDYNDYRMACEGDIPERLWRIYQKVN